MKGLIVAGTHSGVGKTTLSLALMAAARHSGLKVQAFKVGPDFIDPGHHSQITGRASHNLDGWMLSRDENLSIFARYSAGANLVVVEGVMGLYDGYDGLSEAGSTAQMAKWLNLPVLLCVDARAMARSLAALALGFSRFDPEIKWAGLLANRVGGARHVQYLTQAMSLVPELTFWGGLPREPEIELPERHLGLVTADERKWDEEAGRRLVRWLESGLNLHWLLDLLPEAEPIKPAFPDRETPRIKDRVRLGVARDEAFCFYYGENLRRLEAAGAQVVYFSPLRDAHLPPDLDGLYFGGGYPELFAGQLARNYDLRQAVRALGLSGRPIYGECGGFMYLAQTLYDLEQKTWPMTGLIPVEVQMLERLKSLGYRQVTFTQDTPLGPSGLTARGHEFHYSEITSLPTAHQVYKATDREGAQKDVYGFLMGNVLASYVHLHFGSHPQLAENFVAFCRRQRKGLPR